MTRSRHAAPEQLIKFSSKVQVSCSVERGNVNMHNTIGFSVIMHSLS